MSSKTEISTSTKAALFAALAALACAAALGSLAFVGSARTLRDDLRAQARATATQIAERLDDELASAAERSRFYFTHSQSQAFETDGKLLALSLMRRPSKAAAAEWELAQRWVLPLSAKVRIDADELGDVDDKHPIDYGRVAQGLPDAIFADSESLPGFVRLALPYGDREARGYTQAIVAEIAPSVLERLFGHRDDLFVFMAGASGRLAYSSDSGHFDRAENLSRLAVLQKARDSADSVGSLDYRETPPGETQYAAFARVSSVPGLTVVAQASESRVRAAMRPLLFALAAAGAVFSALLGFATSWACARWGWWLGQNTRRLPQSDRRAA